MYRVLRHEVKRMLFGAESGPKTENRHHASSVSPFPAIANDPTIRHIVDRCTYIIEMHNTPCNQQWNGCNSLTLGTFSLLDCALSPSLEYSILLFTQALWSEHGVDEETRTGKYASQASLQMPDDDCHFTPPEGCSSAAATFPVHPQRRILRRNSVAPENSRLERKTNI